MNNLTPRGLGGKSHLEKLQEIRLRLPSLSPAESTLLDVASGTGVAVLSRRNPVPSGIDAAEAVSWGTDRQIRASLIRWLCVDRCARREVDPTGIQVVGARIIGELDLSFVNIPFPISFAYCWLENGATFESAQLPALNLEGTRTPMLRAKGVRVVGDVSLAHGFAAEGEILLEAAQIGGSLVCTNGKITNHVRSGLGNARRALTANCIAVEGDIFLDEGFAAEGAVVLSGARIGGNLTCRGGTFRNPPVPDGASEGVPALHLDNAAVRGSIFLDQVTNGGPFTAEGEVQMIGIRVGGNLECRGGVFRNPKRPGVPESGDALSLDRAIVEGNVFFDPGPKDGGRGPFVAEGSVRLVAAQIEGILDYRNAQITGDFALTGASAGAIVHNKQSLERLKKFALDGFVYERILAGPNNARDGLEWLEMQRPFLPQPYRQLAKVLREMGDDRGARRVLYEMECRRQREKKKNPWQRCADTILLAGVGHGYYPSRALYGLALLVFLGVPLFWAGYLFRGMAPTDKEAYASFEAHGGAGELPPYYERFHASIYSIENSFPLVKLGETDRWEPDPNPNDSTCRSAGCFFVRPGFLNFLRWLQIGLGWFLATLFALGITGVARRE